MFPACRLIRILQPVRQLSDLLYDSLSQVFWSLGLRHGSGPDRDFQNLVHPERALQQQYSIERRSFNFEIS